MDGFSILDPTNWRAGGLKEHPAYIVGNAAAWLTKSGTVGTNHYLTGRLYISKSGWLLLSVPNALVRGVFDAMTTAGAELPTSSAFNGKSADKDLLNAHISVMTAEEVKQIGADKITERGHQFHYALGQIREFSPRTDTLSRVWAIQAASPELAALRKSYGLTPLPNGDHQFHITVADRRKKVLQPNDVAKVDGSRGTAKAASTDKATYDCSCSGPCICPETCTCKRGGRCGAAHATADLLPGGDADNMPDKTFPTEALAEGKQHEREHTNNGQIAKEIAADHLSEDPAYYEKIRKIEGEKTARPAIIQELLEAKNHSDNKRYGHKTQILRKLMEQSPQDWVIDDSAPKYPGITHTPTKFRFHTDRTAVPTGVKAANSVYLNQAQQVFNPFTVSGQQIPYDSNKPVFENIQNQMAEVQRRGDFRLRADRNHQIWRAQLDPNYRYQLALQAFRGELPQPGLTDQLFERYGDGMLASLQPRRF